MGPGCAWFVQNSAAQLDLDHHGDAPITCQAPDLSSGSKSRAEQ